MKNRLRVISTADTGWIEKNDVLGIRRYVGYRVAQLRNRYQGKTPNDLLKAMESGPANVTKSFSIDQSLFR